MEASQLRDQDGWYSGVPAHVFLRRRERVLEELGDGAMILPAAPILYRSRDSQLPYRPDSELFYLTGFTEPEALLVLRGFADEERALLFVRPRDPAAEQWSGSRLGPERARERFGVDAAHPIGELDDRLPKLLAHARRIHFRLGRRRSVENLVIQALEEARSRGSRKGRGPRSVVDPGEILDEMRLRKGPEEIAALREAVRVTVEGFRAALTAAGPGRGEWQLQAELEAAFRREGAQGPAFATIVGSGTNACTLHYVDNSDELGPGDLVLLDAGAEVRMYAGDITRTFPVGGTFSPAQRAVYEVVEEARAAAVQAVRPGVTVRDVHDAAVRILTEGLMELGVLSGSVDELIGRKAHRRYFPHRTSHWLGLDTHDPGDYIRDGEHRRLEAGMVLTVEPGLYFVPASAQEPDGAPEADHPYEGIGVRIEDDVLVTSDGAEVLSRALPTEADEIVEMVGGQGFIQ